MSTCFFSPRDHTENSKEEKTASTVDKKNKKIKKNIFHPILCIGGQIWPQIGEFLPGN
jgi:hypothetical protein